MCGFLCLSFHIGLDQKERLAIQKQQLNKRLGLDVAGMDIGTDELVDETDLIQNKLDTTRPANQVNKVIAVDALR